MADIDAAIYEIFDRGNIELSYFVNMYEQISANADVGDRPVNADADYLDFEASASAQTTSFDDDVSKKHVISTLGTINETLSCGDMKQFHFVNVYEQVSASVVVGDRPVSPDADNLDFEASEPAQSTSFDDAVSEKPQISTQDKIKRGRKPRSNRAFRQWMPDEHERFLQGLWKFGLRDSLGPNGAQLMAAIVKTKTAQQVKSHAQKYFAQKKEIEEYARMHFSR
jgi:SHAQKYF class myb-like DNA-binding protein